MKRIGLIRVVTLKDDNEAGLHGRLLERLHPGFRVVSRCIPDQPKGIYDEETERLAVPKIVELGIGMFRGEKLDALFVSCAADPGVTELRSELQIPVIGAGSSAAALALAYSDRVATMGITEGTPEAMRRVLGNALAGETRPEGVRNTLDLLGEAGRRSAFEACRVLLEASGAGVIALACTGFATIGLASELEKKFKVPVIDPVVAAGTVLGHYLERSA